MPEPNQNDVLRELAPTDLSVFAQLMHELQPYSLHRGARLGTPRVVADFIYFVDSGVVSLVANTRWGNSVEVALVGREGVAGIADALGIIVTVQPGRQASRSGLSSAEGTHPGAHPVLQLVARASDEPIHSE